MAFTGTAVIKQISDSMVRITGLSIGAGANGTIGLAGATGSTPGVRLPASFKSGEYTYNGVTVGLQDSIDCEVNPAEPIGDMIPISVEKTGTTAAAFRITLSNGFASESPGLEIYVRFHE